LRLRRNVELFSCELKNVQDICGFNVERMQICSIMNYALRIMNFKDLFKIRREEWWASIVALLTLVALHAMAISKLFGVYSHLPKGVWNTLIKNYVMSGFDPITYSMVSRWDVRYNVYRHPLLSFMVWPLSQIEDWLRSATGLNLMQIIVAVPLLLCAFYSFIFIYRIFRDVIELRRTDATVLSAMLFSFAYVMVAAIVPDHFCVSMFFLLLTIYIAGVKIKHGSHFKIWQTVLLFALTAGVTLSNGVKTFLYALFANGRKFFRPKYLLLAVLLPSALMWGFARWEYRTFVLPKEKARNEAKAKKAKENREKLYQAFIDTTTIKDSAEACKAFNSLVKNRAKAKYKADHKKAWNKHTGKPMGDGEFMRWTDVTTPRGATAVENFFGESIQLHDQHLLQDTLRSRPVIVGYSWWINYVVEAIIVALFAAGVWCGRRSRFLWMTLSGFAFDVFLHLILGFGINEVYIMGAHWLFVMPIAIAFLVKAAERSRNFILLRSLLILLTLWLWGYNLALLGGYLLG